jgi:hypothetical protein
MIQIHKGNIMGMHSLRAAWILAFLSSAAFAQFIGGPQATGARSSFTLGVNRIAPSFSGNFSGVQDGKAQAFDLDADLGLGRDKTQLGFLVDYQSARFGIQLSNSTQEYKGDRGLNRPVQVNGTNFDTATRLQTSAKLAVIEGIWTIRLDVTPIGWFGIDIGAQQWKTDVNALGTPVIGAALSASSSTSTLLPQLGISGGGWSPTHDLEFKGYLRYLPYRGAKITGYGGEGRYFVTRSVGLRVFYETQKVDIPRGSIKSDLALNLERKGLGFGLVARF